MKAVIIDDEPLARMVVKEYLEEYPAIEVVQECNDGFEGVKAIMQHRPDLVFLDIQMPKINGFEMLELVEQPPAVIFTTAFDEYAIRAFETHAVDYLLKPFSRERFDRAMSKMLSQPAQPAANTKLLVDQAPKNGERIVVKTSGKIRIIPFHEIWYLEAADDYVKIITADGAFLKNRTMAFFEDLLPAHQFVRTHRSYMLNVQQITRIDPYEKENFLAILKDGSKIPVSRSGYGKLKAVLGL